MISRSFYVQVILRVLLIVGFALLIFLIPVYLPIFFSLIPAIALILMSVSLVNYVNRTNQKISLFFDSVKNEDFSLKFQEDLADKSFSELNKRINEVNVQIQDIFLAKRAQDAYFKEVLKQVDVGILSYNSNGHILFTNDRLKKLLNCNNLNHVRQTERVSPDLFELLSGFSPFDRKQIEITNEREIIPLSLKATRFKSLDEHILLLTIHDIRHELEEKETDSWIKLARVLTHEIMNNVTPITSIADTIIDNLKQDSLLIPIEEISHDKLKNTLRGLEVIQAQGQDLMKFVESYRSFLNVPQPQKELIKVVDLFDTLKILLSADLKAKNIALSIELNPFELELYIDRQQILQVLLNLLKNAIQSIENNAQDNGKIQVFAGISNSGNKFIEVRDNGPGITPETLAHIFVPFFTTKDSGSGIGLSISKQIIQLHGGTLQVRSTPGKGASIYLNF